MIKIVSLKNKTKNHEKKNSKFLRRIYNKLIKGFLILSTYTPTSK